ncbi:MAG: hypothetical protein ACR2RE_13135 [Geminicoccaceae bacterium]
MRSVLLLASGLALLILPKMGHAVDCSPFRPDAPVEQSAETEIRAEVGGLLSRLVEVEGEYRVADAQKALGANANDPDSLVKWQSKLYYFCEALNEDETISTRDRIEIMRGIMDANSDARLDEAIGDDIKESQVVNDTGMKLEACVLSNRALSCDFLVQTTETAKELKVYADYQYEASRFIDNQGNTYLANFISLAGVERNNYIITDLPPDVPMRGRLVFENISNRATSGALLEVTGVLEGKVTPFEFRDISFE